MVKHIAMTTAPRPAAAAGVPYWIMVLVSLSMVVLTSGSVLLVGVGVGRRMEAVGERGREGEGRGEDVCSVKSVSTDYLSYGSGWWSSSDNICRKFLVSLSLH